MKFNFENKRQLLEAIVAISNKLQLICRMAADAECNLVTGSQLDGLTDRKEITLNDRERKICETYLGSAFEAYGIPSTGTPEELRRKLMSPPRLASAKLDQLWMADMIAMYTPIISRDMAQFCQMPTEHAFLITLDVVRQLRGAQLVVWEDDAVTAMLAEASSERKAGHFPERSILHVEHAEYWNAPVDLRILPEPSIHQRNLDPLRDWLGELIWRPSYDPGSTYLAQIFGLDVVRPETLKYVHIDGAHCHPQIRLYVHRDGHIPDDLVWYSIALAQAFMNSTITETMAIRSTRGSKHNHVSCSASNFVVTLRKHVRVPVQDVSCPDASESPNEAQQDATRNFNGHWTVKGHWRNQWYPSIRDHKRIWIPEYEKGDRGQPLKPKLCGKPDIIVRR